MMHWLLWTLYLNVVTGNIVKVDPPKEVDVAVCLQVHEPEPAKDGLVPFQVCRQVDADGNPIPEEKFDPSKPEPSKVPT
jgi:hypothetical protein